MPINPIYNDIEMGTAWAEDAATTIPSVPVPGIAYRNTGLSEETVGTGQQYDSIGRSADWNELLYKISANIITLQRGGATLLWISGRQYEQGALVKDPNNAQIYYRKKAGAGTTRPSSDSTNWQLLQDLFCGEGLLVNSNNEITWGSPTTQNTDCNALIKAGIYRVGGNASNVPTDIENSTRFIGFLHVTRFGATIQQIAYEVNTSGAFSMNTRLSYNSGSRWTAWTRFGVNFTLDWNSGHDYRVGDLVRDTSSGNLFVCTTAISNSTNRPGLDSSHFTMLPHYLTGDGLSIANNKITWGNIDKIVDDIDTVRTSGTYRVNESTENNPLKNNLGTTGTLIVLNNSNTSASGTRVLQLLIPSAASETTLLAREANGLTAWNNWRMAAAFDALDFQPGQTYNQGQLVRGSNNIHYVKKTAASVCNTEPNSDSANFETLAQNLIDQGLLVIGNKINWGNCNAVSTKDANEAVESGVYYVNSDAANIPNTYRGFIITLRSSNNPNYTAHQLYFALGASVQEIHSRTYVVNTGWNNWIKIGPAKEVSAADLAGNGLTAASNKLNWGTASNVTNANNVTTPGTYALTSSSTNTPTKNGIMLVVKKPDGTVSQVIFDSDTGKTYSRDKTGSAWSTWYSTTSSIGADMSAGKQNRSFGTLYTADTDGFVELTACSNWRSNTNGQLYINNNEIAVNHTGQYGSGGQSSGVQTTIYVRAGDTYKCNQGSLEYYWWFPNT